jgi:hypothetical protein
VARDTAGGVGDSNKEGLIVRNASLELWTAAQRAPGQRF